MFDGCPVCTHTVSCVTGGVWHCERCGTVVTSLDSVYMPKLVDRCRMFEDVLLAGEILDPEQDTVTIDKLRAEWRKIGIAESIHPPEKRRL